MGGGLTSAKAGFRSIRGLISSSWAVKDGEFTLAIGVPANTTATVYVPAADAASVKETGKPAAEAEGVKLLHSDGPETVFEVQSGNYIFTVKQ